MKCTIILSGILIVYATVLYILLYRNVTMVLNESVDIHTALEAKSATQATVHPMMLEFPTDDITQHMTTTPAAPKDGTLLTSGTTNTTTVSKDIYTSTASSTENGPKTLPSTESPDSVIDEYRARCYNASTWSLSFAVPTDCASLQLPVNVIYVSESETPNCNDQTTCKELLNEQYISTSQTADFSFLLTGDSAILEGMAWNCSVGKFGNKSILVMLTGKSNKESF